MYRSGFRMRLQPGCEAIYKAKHDQIWPELLERLKGQGIVRYAIYRDGLDLFAHLEATEPQTPGESVDPVVRRWWDMMAEFMETTEDNSPKTWPLEEMFWMESI
jgi:L-rhamnose mutarotase